MHRYIFGPFLAGITFPLVLFPFIYLLAYAYQSIGFPEWSWDIRESIMPLMIVGVVALAFGVYNILFVILSGILPGRNFVEQHWLAGFFLGAALPIAGIVTGEPALLFGDGNPLAFLLIPLSMLFFGAIWRWFIAPINSRLWAE